MRRHRRRRCRCLRHKALDRLYNMFCSVEVPNSKNTTILSNLLESALSKSKLISSHAPALSADVVAENFFKKYLNRSYPSNFNNTAVLAVGDHTFSLKPVFELKSNFASKSS